jgi:HD-GYP domain-containing protein (c-di-GMP phosphodiesterase class II)
MRLVMASEQLVGEARERRARMMDARELRVIAAFAAGYVAVSLAMALLLPSERDPSVWLVAGLVVGHALICRVRFEFAGGYVVPEQLVLVPLMLLGPLNLVPALIAVSGTLALIPDMARGTWSRDSWLNPLSEPWCYLAPVLILAALAPGEPTLSDWPVYALALAAQLVADFVVTALRNKLLDEVPLREFATGFIGASRVELILSPVAFVATLVAVEEPVVLIVVFAPLVWMLDNFSKERWARHAAALELNRAYRGTVMLLSDVLEHEDEYTADHSRSVVDLVNAVADELGIEAEERQELEFAAMLHDVGKISIPKEILHKPAALTDPEFEIIKGHTIEGQFMLDRVGGLLGRVGDVVRSCHERWDGKGYPDGLAGENIPLAARIVFVCDAYNAMTTDRPYRTAMSPNAAVKELIDNAGTQFDPTVVAGLVSVIEQGAAPVTTTDGVRAVLAGRPAPEGARAPG